MLISGGLLEAVVVVVEEKMKGEGEKTGSVLSTEITCMASGGSVQKKQKYTILNIV